LEKLLHFRHTGSCKVLTFRCIQAAEEIALLRKATSFVFVGGAEAPGRCLAPDLDYLSYAERCGSLIIVRVDV
jgi:hypothetical protein